MNAILYRTQITLFIWSEKSKNTIRWNSFTTFNEKQFTKKVPTKSILKFRPITELLLPLISFFLKQFQCHFESAASACHVISARPRDASILRRRRWMRWRPVQIHFASFERAPLAYLQLDDTLRPPTNIHCLLVELESCIQNLWILGKIAYSQEF